MIGYNPLVLYIRTRIIASGIPFSDDKKKSVDHHDRVPWRDHDRLVLAVIHGQKHRSGLLPTQDDAYAC